MKNVCFLFGINGVGKSTVAGHVISMVKGSVRLSSSEVLRRAFGDVSRDELERMPAYVKRDALRVALTEAFTAHQRASLVVCEMHLVACIRRNGVVSRERMWHDSFLRHARAYCLISSPKEAVLRRRDHDIRATGRVRSLDSSGIHEDAITNEAEFRQLFSGKENAFIARNNGTVAQTARVIVERSAKKNVHDVLMDTAG